MTQPKRSSGSTKTKKAPAKEAENANVREVIARLSPGNVVVVSRDLLQDAFDEAVRRGRVTRSDAEDLLGDVFARGRKQTEGLIGELEQLLKRADAAAGRVRRTGAGDRVVRVADRARRTVGVGPAFPIIGYDELTAAQVTDRLGELSPAQLRKVRDYERRHANRKSVLDAIERALG